MNNLSAPSFRRRLLRQAASIGYYGLGIAVCIFTAVWVSQATDQLRQIHQLGWTRLLPLLLVWLGLAASLLVHEGGHWLGSQLAGFRCFAVVVWWLHLERGSAGWRVRLGCRPVGRGGYVRALPVSFARLRQH